MPTLPRHHSRAVLLVALALGGLVSTTAAQTSPAPPATGEDARIQALVRNASPARVERDVRALVGFGTRHTLADTTSRTRGIGAARRWLFAEFTRISQACGGCLQVIYVDSLLPAAPNSRIRTPTRLVNVVAIQRGRTDPSRYVVIQGHYDSRVNDVMDAAGAAPGADDDASGTAATVEAARLLSTQRFDATIVYAALAGEEQGLFGGEILARTAQDRGWNVEAVLNNDIVGNTHGGTGLSDNRTVRIFAPGIPPSATVAELRRFLYSGGELDTPSRELGRYIVRTAEQYLPNLEARLVYRLDRFGRGGDHTPFFLRGFPAVRITETNENYARQHQTLRTENGIAYGDVPEMVDYPYLASVTALNAATAASLAWAPAPPDSVAVIGAVSPNTTLRWAPPRGPGVAGYRIYWRRPTNAAWEHSRWVGNVREAVLENIVVDDYFFGVAAVDADGHESIPVFPRPGRD